MPTCPEHLKPYLASLTVRVALGASSREEAESAAKALFGPLDSVRCEERMLFVSARAYTGNAKGEIQAVALPGGGVKSVAEEPADNG